MAINTEDKTNRYERFKRIHLMLGEEACEKLRSSSVTVVGLGAVGGYALEALARSGVGKLRLVDFDRVGISNMNRQLLALESTLGRPKCEVARERVMDINPWCEVEIVNGFLDGDNVWEFVGESPDLVIDAIDALNPKVELIQALVTNNIRHITSLGAALRSDPTMVRVGPLSEVQGCPLGRAVRSRLRRRNVPVDFLCVYSREPLPRPLPVEAPVEDMADEQILKRGRARNTLGSLPTITGIFGLTAANTAIKMLTGRD